RKVRSEVVHGQRGAFVPVKCGGQFEKAFVLHKHPLLKKAILRNAEFAAAVYGDARARLESSALFDHTRAVVAQNKRWLGGTKLAPSDRVRELVDSGGVHSNKREAIFGNRLCTLLYRHLRRISEFPDNEYLHILHLGFCPDWFAVTSHFLS